MSLHPNSSCTPASCRRVALPGALAVLAACLTGCADTERTLDDFFVLRHPELDAGAPVVAATQLICFDQTDGELRLGAGWGCEVWLDGDRILSQRSRRQRTTELDQFRVPIALARGGHDLVVLWLNGAPPALDAEREVTGDPGCVLRFAADDGTALAGLALVAPGGIPGRDTWALAPGRRVSDGALAATGA